MDAKAQLEALVRIQELALEIREAEETIAQKPSRLEAIEAHFRERNAEYVAVRDQYDEIDTDRKSRAEHLKELEERREKYQANLMDVKNQREYAAMLKEIDTVKAEISENEDAVLKGMEALETLKGELANHEGHIQAEREKVEKDSVEVLAAAAAAEQRLTTLRAERGQLERDLPEGIRQQIMRLEASRQGVFLAKSDNGTCMSCFVRVRPQVFQEIKIAAALHTCDSCRRFLYYEAALKPQEQAVESTSSARPDVQAADGQSL